MTYPCQVAIIDDSEEDRFFIKRMLKRYSKNLIFVEFDNVEKAILWLSQVPLSQRTLIFLDLDLPVVSGFDCLTKLSKMNPFEKAFIRVVVTTNSIDPKDEKEALAYPFVSRFIRKRDLSTRIAEFVDGDLVW